MLAAIRLQLPQMTAELVHPVRPVHRRANATRISTSNIVLQTSACAVTPFLSDFSSLRVTCRKVILYAAAIC
jgi:hypothetical protein